MTNTQKKVLVIGSGGREHALAWTLSRSPQVGQVFVAPGNGGTEWSANDASGLRPGAASENVAIEDFEGLIHFAQEQNIDLIAVGPEVPLSKGIVDAFQKANLTAFGPSQAAAQLEASKAFSKDFMAAHGIPTAAYGAFENIQEAYNFLDAFDRPVVVKADGLAAGKGVLICDSPDEARDALKTVMQDRQFGTAGDKVVIEEKLEGREFSVLAFCDGKTVKPMIVARDHKRALDGDEGLNTGGMGAFAPTTDISEAQIDAICREILQPTLDGMAAQGTPYVGVLYAGLMQTDAGMRVLEFNCRFGDPETQVILPLLETDLYEIMLACAEGRLHEVDLRWKNAHCATVVLASGGYPEHYQKGFPISGLDTVAERDNVIVFHAGTKKQNDDIVTNGGRVIAVTAVGNSLDAALESAYDAVSAIHFDRLHYRRDIGRTIEEPSR